MTTIHMSSRHISQEIGVTSKSVTNDAKKEERLAEAVFVIGSLLVSGLFFFFVLY